MRRRRHFPWGIFFFFAAPAEGALYDGLGLWPPLAYCIAYSTTSWLYLSILRRQASRYPF